MVVFRLSRVRAEISSNVLSSASFVHDLESLIKPASRMATEAVAEKLLAFDGEERRLNAIQKM